MEPRHAASRRALGVLATLLAIGPGTGCAQTAAQPPTPAATAPAAAASAAKLPSVDEIVAAHVAARGGADRLHALQSMRATGLAKAGPGRVAPVVREIARPGKIRLEITYQGLSSVYAHDGTAGWQVAPMQGKFDPEPLPAEIAAPSVDQLDIEGPLLDWRKKGHQVHLVGRATVGDRAAYDLETRLSSGIVRHDFVDAETWMILRTDTERVAGGRRVMLETTFDDYRAVGGIKFPHHVVTQARGRPQKLEFTVEKIELDPVIDPARFQLPR